MLARRALVAMVARLALAAGLVAGAVSGSMGCTTATATPILAARSTPPAAGSAAGPSASASASSSGTTAGPGPGAFGPGSDGIGDPYFPTAGNGGYDVGHYDLDLRYDPATDRLTGMAVITATATANLSRFNLDLRALTVESVTVDGTGAATTRTGDELVVTPLTPIGAGTTFATTVRYAGVPQAYAEPGLGGEVGFLHTDDGAVAVGEPHVAASWFPVNDHPRDKATYTITIDAPDGLTAVSNGVLTQKSTADGWTSWTWSERAPMASYLATVVVGSYRVQEGRHDGLPVFMAVDSSLDPQVDAQLARTPQVVDFLESRFGPYPFAAIGGIVIDDRRIRFALENQSRPVYSGSFFLPNRGSMWVIVHELAHQWYGDSVSISEWKDIWLNEGFATYAEWLWTEAQEGIAVQRTFDSHYGQVNAEMWNVPPGSPGTGQLFGPSVYIRGGMTVHALRVTVGDDAFFRILKAWAAEKANSNATTADLVALAERISGKQLDQLFDDWLYRRGRPPAPTR